MIIDVPDRYWKQAQLSQSFGGLDLRSLAEHSCAVFISSMTSSGQCSPDDRHMMQAVTRFNSQVPLHESITVEAVLASPSPQKYLHVSKRLHSEAFQSLLSSSSPVNKAPILSVFAPHAGSWISANLSTGLALHLEPAECQVALWWWLGLDTSGGSLCPLCPNIVLNPLGHHAARRCGDVVTMWQNQLRDISADFCRRTHLSMRVEVGYGLSRNQSPSLVYIPLSMGT